MIDADSFFFFFFSFFFSSFLVFFTATKGSLSIPIGGQRSTDIWVATSGAYNEWVSVGNFDPGNRMCRTHLGTLKTIATVTTDALP